MQPASRRTSLWSAMVTISPAISLASATPARPSLPRSPSVPSVLFTATIGYDVLNRSTGMSWNPVPAATASAAASVSFAHAYNKANQRIGQSASDNSWLNYPPATPSTISYATNALNQYTSVGAMTPSYDANGNLTFDGSFNPSLLCWHGRGRRLYLCKRPEGQCDQEGAKSHRPGSDVEPRITCESVVDQTSGQWPCRHAEAAGHGRSPDHRTHH